MTGSQSKGKSAKPRTERVLIFDVSPSAANFWFDAFNVALFVGAAIVAVATYGVFKTGAIKEKFSDERISSNEKDVALSKERTALLEKETAQARLEQERLKAALAWRSLSQEQAKAFSEVAARSPGSVNLRYTDGDPEALALAIQIANLLIEAKWQVAPGAQKFDNALVFGIALPDSNESDSKILGAAFDAVHIPYSNGRLPPQGVSFNVTMISGAITLVIGSKYPAVAGFARPEAN